MSDIHRDNDKTLNPFSISKSLINNDRRTSKDDNEEYYRKRTNSQRITNLDAKVYVGNVPTDYLTDNELLNFFKPFGKVSDIRVYKGYIFVQYDRIDDARKLIKEGQTSLLLKGNKLDILPAMEASLTSTKLSSIELSSRENKSLEQQLSKNSRRYSDYDRHSSNYEPHKKKYLSKNPSDDKQTNKYNFIINNKNNYDDSIGMEIDNDHRRVYISSSKSCSRRLSRSSNGHSFDLLSDNHQSFYTILTGPEDQRQLVDCQIIIVNPRQKGYAEEISSHLRCHGLITSIILLREDYTLTEAIENAARQQCFYGIIVMPMHEERRTASFHILYGQTEEHRNLTLEDGYHIILNNFTSYKERIQNKEINSFNRKTNESILYSEPIESCEYISQEQTIPIESRLSINDKLPLSMLLCLLADGRQLTLDEIDRVLVYLLEKKAKMLTLPQGTLPPLPLQYATKSTLNHQTGCDILSDSKSISTRRDISSTKCSSSSEFSSNIAEQIRQILSTNLVKPSSLNSTEEIIGQHLTTKNNFESLNDIIKLEDTNICQSKINIKETTKEYGNFQQEQEKNESSFSYTKSNPSNVVTPSFHYSSTTNGTPTSFVTPTFSSYDSLPVNSPLKQSTAVTHSNFISQPSQYLYPIPPPLPPPPPSLPTQNMYQPLSSSAAADAAAAIFQAYSQFNARPTPLVSPIVSQQTMTQQQQIRK